MHKRPILYGALGILAFFVGPVAEAAGYARLFVDYRAALVLPLQAVVGSALVGATAIVRDEDAMRIWQGHLWMLTGLLLSWVVWIFMLLA